MLLPTGEILTRSQKSREPVNVVHRGQHLRSQNGAEKLESDCGVANESIQHRGLLKTVLLFLDRVSRLGISTNQLVGKWGLNVLLKFHKYTFFLVVNYTC